MLHPSLLILYALGGFYTVVAIGIFNRARRPSCRNCLYWQTCLNRRLGVSGPPPKRCLDESQAI